MHREAVVEGEADGACSWSGGGWDGHNCACSRLGSVSTLIFGTLNIITGQAILWHDRICPLYVAAHLQREYLAARHLPVWHDYLTVYSKHHAVHLSSDDLRAPSRPCRVPEKAQCRFAPA